MWTLCAAYWPRYTKGQHYVGPPAFPSIYHQTLINLVHQRCCCHVSSQSTSHFTRVAACRLDSRYTFITNGSVQLCCWLCSHKLWLCWFAFFFLPHFENVGTWETDTLSFLLYSFSSVSWLVRKCAGEMLQQCLFPVCAPNTIVCWELLGYWPKKNIYTVF